MASTDEYQVNKAPSKLEATRKYIYNSETGACLGRTCSSWAKLLVFYAIYYACLAGFFAICIAVFFTTLDKDYPRQQGYDSLVKYNPGMGFRPMPDVDSTLIRFEQGKPSSYKVFTDHIQAFLEQYENEAQEGEDFIDCDNLQEEDREHKKVCRFKVDQLGDECTWQKDYGYDEGTPCVLLKLNKVYGWTPEEYENGTEPANIAGQITQGNIHVTCEGENPGDAENMGPLEFYPPNGFPIQYYPYLNQRGYRQPVVFVKFARPEEGVVMQIWCKAWASNLYHHKNDKAASIHFELLVD